MLRIVVETCDAGMAANVGGSVDRSMSTFDIEAPELEAFLREFTDAGKQGQQYWHRRAIGVEVLPNIPLHVKTDSGKADIGATDQGGQA